MYIMIIHDNKFITGFKEKAELFNSFYFEEMFFTC